jgi:outer membrane protein assembly factor BamB
MDRTSQTTGARKRVFRTRWAISTLVLALTIIIAGAIVAFPRHMAAHAALPAAIRIIPKSASYSAQTGIVVSGTHFGANETVKVYWNYTGPNTGTPEGSPVASGTGAFAFKFPIPLAPAASYTIAAIGQTSGFIATGTFQLLPQVYASPEAGGAGAKFNVYGNAFGNGETVNIYWNYTGPSTGTQIGSIAANTTGSFIVNVAVPTGATPGNIPVGAVGATSGDAATFTYVLYSPTLTLAPLSGSAGSQVTLTGYGFQKNENVNIYFNNGTTPLLTAKTNSNVYGYMPPQTITIPGGTTPGSYPVTAVGATSTITATNTFTVAAPGSNLSNTTGPVGTSVIASAQGYTPGETVNVIWGYTGPSTGSTIASTTAGPTGLVNTSFNIPTATSGARTVAVVGASSGAVTKNTYTIATGLSSNPATTTPGASVTVAGSGFQANEQVNIYLDSTSGTLLATATADVNGNISQAVTIPASAAPGSHSLIGVGKTSSTSLTAALTLDTRWGDFGFDPANTRWNTFENTLNTSNVSGLTLKWSAAADKNFRGTPVYANGIVYIATNTGMLEAYNATTGTLKWKFNSGTGFNNLSAPLVDPATNTVFFGTIGYESTGIPSPAYALDAQTGKLKWSIILAWNDYAPPTLAGSTIYVGTARGANTTQLYSINDVTGAVNWQDTVNGSIWGAVAVDTGASKLFAFVSSPASAVLSFDAATGASGWQYVVSGSLSSTPVGSGVTVANGLVYFNGKNGTVYAVNEGSGSLQWSRFIGNQPIGSGNVASLAVANGLVYAGSLNDTLFALSATTGSITWQKTAGIIWGSPEVANGVLYYATLGGKRVTAANAATGAVLWSNVTGNLDYSSPITANGWVYCGSTDGKLYAFHL